MAGLVPAIHAFSNGARKPAVLLLTLSLDAVITGVERAFSIKATLSPFVVSSPKGPGLLRRFHNRVEWPTPARSVETLPRQKSHSVYPTHGVCQFLCTTAQATYDWRSKSKQARRGWPL